MQGCGREDGACPLYFPLIDGPSTEEDECWILAVMNIRTESYPKDPYMHFFLLLEKMTTVTDKLDQRNWSHF